MSYSNQALNFLEDGKLEDFDKQYKLALKNDSDDLLYSLAEELYSLGFTEQSTTIYKKLLKKYPQEDELRSNLADIAINDGKNDEALNYLGQISPNSPDYVQALMVEADLYQTQGLFEVSIQKLLEAKKIAPDEEVITFALAELYFTMRKFNKAIPLYLNLIKKGYPKYTSVNLVERIGVAYANAGRFGHAIGYLKQINIVNASPDVQFETAFTYLQLNKYDEAIKLFKNLRDNDDQYSTLYPYLGDALLHQNKENDALKVYQEGLSVDEYNEKLWTKAADVSLKLNNEQQAEKYYIKGNKIAPEDLTIVVKMSNLLVKQGKYQNNIDFLSSYVKKDTLDPKLFWNLATSYAHLDNLKLASGYYRNAEYYFGNDADFLKEAGLFFRESSDMKESKKLLKEYIHLVPSDEEIAQMLNEY